MGQQQLVPLVYTPAEAAEVLGISRSKVYDLMRTGVLHSVLLGRRRRIPIAAVLALLSGDDAA